jgi:hypothetical protein
MSRPNPLEDYILIYEVTILPTILFAQLVKANEPLEFKDFELPQETIGSTVECRFSLYDKEGKLLELSSNTVPGYPSTIVASLNIVPLKMIKTLLTKLKL